MIKMDKKDRFESFNNINRAILNQENVSMDFDEAGIYTYRCFADGLIQLFVKTLTATQNPPLVAT